MPTPDADKPLRAQQVIEDEFGLYYLADELPQDDDVLSQSLPQHTADSTRRLGRSALDLLPAMVIALERAAADPHDPLVARLSVASVLEWRGEDLWPIFQEIATQIAAKLREAGG